MSSSSKPTTPRTYHKSERRHLRRSSGLYKILPQSPKVHYPVDPDQLPLETENNLEKIEDLFDQVDQMERHMYDLRVIQDAISNGFNEPFASFLYGMNITMWCNNFPSRPSKEQWDKLKEVEGLDSRIEDLKLKVSLQRSENEKLKAKLKTPSSVKPPPRVEASGFAQPKPPARSNLSKAKLPSTRYTPAQQQNTVAYSDDTDHSTESFIVNPRVSRIPQPGGRSSRPLVGTSGTRESSSSIYGEKGPNLNQPPRYMRGLFDSSNTVRPSDRPKRTSAVSSRGRVNKLANRPPFR